MFSGNMDFSIDVSVSPRDAHNGQDIKVSIRHTNPNVNLVGSVASIDGVKQNELKTPYPSLKRRRTDDDLQRDRRSKADEIVDFCLAGVNTRTHFRIRRADPFWRSLDAFAERKGKKAGHLSLFYEGQWVSRISTPDDLGLAQGDCLHVYEMIP